MQLPLILQCLKDAKRFIELADAARVRLENDSTCSITGCRETGAARRASMDLTRSLANLRKTDLERDQHE